MATANTSTVNKLLAQSVTIPAALAALAFSLAIFGFMHKVIEGSHAALEAKEALPTIDFVRLKRDTEVETLSRSKPPPPAPPPPPPAKMKVAAVAVPTESLTGMEIPDLDLSANVGGAALVGTKAMFDGDIIPLQCPPVSYPSDARRAGLSGWVQIEFVVGPDGSVRSAKAVDAQPRGVFEAAAVMAAQRCRFKPKMVDGKPVEQRGRRKWNFDLNKAG
jgi:TonB family C-terminal domain